MDRSKAHEMLRTWAYAPVLVKRKKELLAECRIMIRCAYGGSGSGYLERVNLPRREDCVDNALSVVDRHKAYARAIEADIRRIALISRYVYVCMRPEGKAGEALLQRYRYKTPWADLARKFKMDEAELRMAEGRTIDRMIAKYKGRHRTRKPAGKE